jgi:ubiquitin carboxyl-terminal hydrolase 4/11/15
VIVGSSALADHVLWEVRQEAGYDSENLYAFEITSSNKFYVPCIVQGERLISYTAVDGTDRTFPRAVVVAGPFLLEFDEPDPSEAAVAAAAAAYLSAVWEPGLDFKVTTDLSSFANSIARSKASCPKDQKFAVSIPGRHGLSRSPLLKCATQKLVALELNPTFSTPATGFSILSLIRHHRRPATQFTARPDPAQSHSLDRFFAFFSAPEVLDEANEWFCPRCRTFVCAEKTTQIWAVPRCLIVHLKRFTSQRKLDDEVDYPDVLDMAPYVCGPQRNGRLKYRLYAVSEHVGSLGGGHYTASARVGDDWYSFDDTCTRKISHQQAHSRSAYILFYERIGAAVPE